MSGGSSAGRCGRRGFYIKVKVKVSRNRPRWPKGFRIG
jgi:hypothetical protein